MRCFIQTLFALLFLNLSWTACGSHSSNPSTSSQPVVSEGSAPPLESENGTFWVSVSWSENLTAGTLANSALVKFTDTNKAPLAAELSSFKLFMPSMGHGSIKTKEMVLAKDPLQANTWSVSNIYFSMGGASDEWVVDITATVNGVSDKVRVVIPYEVGE